MWRSDLFEWKGQFFDVPPTAIIPKPVQRPHPPIFVACSRPETVVTAGSLGLGSLNFVAGNDELLVQKVRMYREAVAAAPTTSRRTNNYFCCTPMALVLDDDRKACQYGFRGARFFGEALATYFFSPTPHRRSAGHFARQPAARAPGRADGEPLARRLDLDRHHRRSGCRPRKRFAIPRRGCRRADPGHADGHRSTGNRYGVDPHLRRAGHATFRLTSP